MIVLAHNEREQLNDVLLAQVCEAVRPHRPDGHGAAWAVLAANHDQLKAWVVTEGLTAVKAHELLGRQGIVVPERTRSGEAGSPSITRNVHSTRMLPTT